MGVPRAYSIGTGVQVQVDALDIATGVGLTNIYAGLASGASTLTPAAFPNAYGIMSNIPFFSSPVFTTLQMTDNLYFELDFELPRIIKGEAIVQVPWKLTSGAAFRDRVLVSMALIDTTGLSTDIVSGVTGTIENAGAGFVASLSSVVLQFPNTKFKKGERLRMLVRPNGTTGSDNAKIVHDPMGRVTFGIHGALIAQLPFKTAT